MIKKKSKEHIPIAKPETTKPKSTQMHPQSHGAKKITYVPRTGKK